MKRILAAVDGSQPSVRAARHAVDIAPKLGLKVTLAHVMPEHTFLAEWTLGGDEAELHRLRDQEGCKLLKKVAAEVEAPGVPVDTRCLFGTPAEAIAEAARDEDVEMIVVGSRGRTLIGGVLIGSVAHRLVHISGKPILIVH